MVWGLDQKLKDHMEMINSEIDSKIKPLSEHIHKVDNDFQTYKLDCLEHRRRQGDEIKTIILSQQRSELSQQNTDKNVQCIKNILETYLPNLKDAEEKRATRHQLKEGALWLSAIVGAVVAVAALMAAVWAYLSGFLNNITAIS